MRGEALDPACFMAKEASTPHTHPGHCLRTIARFPYRARQPHQLGSRSGYPFAMHAPELGNRLMFWH